MDEREREEIREEREGVEDEIEAEGGETEEQAAEQRTDDYDGIVRRLDEMSRAIADGFASIGDMIGALGVIGIESGGFSTDNVVDEAKEAVADVLDIEDLNLL